MKNGKYRVVVVIESGSVVDAYASDDCIELEVVDTDVQTPEEEAAATRAMRELEEEIASGKLHSLM